ncbi:hypothetical protein [Novosphingobium sp.]|uniref:hypothetical protein n=1 Tax=Novosphingobium sp. TaxID=1874826 RepID=UPI0035AE1CBC
MARPAFDSGGRLIHYVTMMWVVCKGLAKLMPNPNPILRTLDNILRLPPLFEEFNSQFEVSGKEYRYRFLRRGPAFAVSREQRDAFRKAGQNTLRWIFGGGAAGCIALIAAFLEYYRRTKVEEPVAIPLAIILLIVVTAAGLVWLGARLAMRLPERQLRAAGVEPEAPPLKRLEVQPARLRGIFDRFGS